MKKISRFFATVSATALLATGAVFAPAASAWEVRIEDDVCYLTETPADTALLMSDLEQAGHTVISLLKADLPERVADIDAILAAPGILPPLHEMTDLVDRLDADAVAAGYDSGEALLLLMNARTVITDWGPVVGDPDDWGVVLPEPSGPEQVGVTRPEAQQYLEQIQDFLPAWEQDGMAALNDWIINPDENDAGIVHSDRAEPVLIAFYQPYVNHMERAIPAYEACLAGEEGSFPAEPGEEDPREEQPGTGGNTGGSSGLFEGLGSS